MSDIQHIVFWLKANPEILAVAFGTLASWSGATLLEALFMPTS